MLWFVLICCEYTPFERIKQNFPLKYFFGDNQNAVENQIWVSLII